ncbi:MAG: PBP1A family penicillin-binding protein [Candidatus Levybacteria bacterium]|nr:PBP1A family penicillin-binding protein [Candidatus Levybacteria bacterium]
MAEYSRRRRRYYSSINIFLLSRLARFAFFGLIGAVVLLIILFIWYGRDLPTPGKLSASNLSQSTRILDRNGIVLYDIFNQQNRTYVELSVIPKTLQQATIAIEDKDFYTNKGFSITGYLRVVRNLLLLQGLSGGSTLTQQLVKNTLLTSERTIPRKIKEFILAVQVDRKYTKDQILELYLNVAPYGGTAVGVETASESYFGKKAKDLNLVESAILAGLPQRPSYYSPNGAHPKAYVDRAKDVLRRMREDGYITSKQEKDADNSLASVKFAKQAHSIKAPHFSFYVKDLLIKQFGENMVEQGGLQVYTTLDYKLQEKAEEIVNEEVSAARYLKVGNGASVVLNPKNGEILAMVGSKDFFATESASTGKNKVAFDGQFNVITQALRQPGSSIKPVTYATALQQGYTAATLLMDAKTVFPNQGEKDYTPVNYDGKYHGPVQMRFALGSSLNIPAVKMLAMVGIKNMLITANDMGLTTLAPTSENIRRFGLSLTLGGGEVHPLDLASAYCAFANGGFRVEPIAILKITDSKGNVLYEHKDVVKRKVISEEVAFIISHILLDNNARLLTFGENSYLNIRGRTIAVKTGTTDDKRDNWTIGWTPSVLVATWVGNNDNSEMGNVASGVTGAAPIWRRIILEALKNKSSEDFPVPANVVALTIDSYGGGAPIDGKPTRSEYFIKGTEPQGPSQIYKQLKISKEDNKKLASDSEVAKGEYDTKKFIVLSENDPISTDGKNRWQDGINDWINENYKDDSMYHPPTEKSNRVVSDNPTPTPSPTPTPTITVTLTP